MANRTFSVKITGDAKDLKRAFGDADSAAKQFNRDLAKFGKRGALALAGIAAASTKMAADFESSLSKMVGLVGLADGEVDGFKDTILALSGETARAPQELADAMFFITSAGLRGADALEALEVSAKGSAAGLGATKDVAFAAVSAVNAYGKENITATQAVDILTATIREGNVEASEVAGVLGNIIPVAAEMGVSFDQVGAALAAMTRLGADAASSATSLQAIMSAMLKPTVQAEAALREVGLSAAGLRTQLGNEGLLPVLFSVREAFIGNDEAIAQVFGNVRALRGVMNLAGESAETTAGIFDRMRDTVGKTADAFGAWADTEASELDKALNNLKIIGTEVGEDILPQIASVLSDNEGAIQDSATAIGDMAISLVDLAVAAEPVLQFLPDVADGVGAAFNSFINVGAGLGSVLTSTWGRVIPVLGEVSDSLGETADRAAGMNRLKAALRDLGDETLEGAERANRFGQEVAQIGNQGLLVEGALNRLATATNLTKEEQADALFQLIEYADAQGWALSQTQLLEEQIASLGISTAELAERWGLTRQQVEFLVPGLEELNQKFRDQKFIEVARTQVDNYVDSLIAASGAAPQAAAGVRGSTEAIEANTEAIKANQAEIRKAIDPVFRLRDAEEKRNEAVEKFNEATKKGKTSQEDLNDLAQDAADAQADLEFAFELVNGQITEGITLIEGYGTRAGISADAIARLREETIKLAAAMRTLPSVGEARALDVDDPARIRILKEELERRARGEVGA